jgi:cysteine-rich repeat protein
MLAASLVLATESVWAAPDKNDRKCIDATGAAIQKYTAAALKELSKCGEKPADPSTANCDTGLPKITKAASTLNNTIAKKCKKLDPVRAFGYAGCQIPGCEGVDQSATAAGYQACVVCASEMTVAQMSRIRNGCGNGFVDAGEQCDDGNIVDGDGCSAACEIESICGNNAIESGEQCDPPGNIAPSCAQGETCSMTCECIGASVMCGDGVVEGDEQCDPPGNLAPSCATGEVCNSRCECAPPCDCCDLMPTQLQTTVKVGSGICGQLRNFRCSNDTNAACANDADCNFGTCIVGPNICTDNFTAGICAMIGDADCVGTCGEVVALNLPLDLECGGLYTGGGGNSVPLPFNIPDASSVLSKVVSCDSESGQIITGAVTQAEADQLSCSEGKKCSVSKASCVLDGDCPMAEICESLCLFGAPLPVPNPGTPPTSVCTVNVVAQDLAGTGSCDGDSTVSVSLRSEIFLTGDLFQMSTPPDLPGVQPCPLCTRICAGGANLKFPCADDSECPGSTCTAGTLCLGGPNDTIGCTPGTSDSATLGDTEGAFPTSHNCPPEPMTTITDAIGGLPIDLSFTTGTQVKQAVDFGAASKQRVFCGFCRDIDGAGTLIFEGNTMVGPPAIPAADGNAVPCTSDADCQADSDEYESCAQRTAGAFSEAASTVFSMTGTPAECLADGLGKAAVAVGGFCIPPTFDATVDAAGDLPGPGAVSLAVEAQLLP